MNVLITITRGIIRDAVFFDDPQMAVLALSKFVKNMNPEDDDAAVYDDNGFVANAKDFLDENDEYVEEEILVGEVSEEKPSHTSSATRPTTSDSWSHPRMTRSGLRTRLKRSRNSGR